MHLAGLSTAAVGRELGDTVPRVDQQLADATRDFCEDTGASPESVLAALESLAPVADAAALPPLSAVEQGGRRRRRTHAVVGALLAVVLTLLGGTFVTAGGSVQDATSSSASGSEKEAEPPAAPVTEEMLLGLAHVRGLAPRERWRLLGTSDNTAGDGINTVCQDTRFADPRGRGAFVRTFAAPAVASAHLPGDRGDLAQPAAGGRGLPDHAGMVRRL